MQRPYVRFYLEQFVAVAVCLARQLIVGGIHPFGEQPPPHERGSDRPDGHGDVLVQGDHEVKAVRTAQRTGFCKRSEGDDNGRRGEIRSDSARLMINWNRISTKTLIPMGGT